jgi:hypothetical protein
MNRHINDLLMNINISLRIAKDVNHGISFGRSGWNIFEPTKFVYAFNTLNMLYEKDWEHTMLTNKIIDNRSTKYANDKILILLEFINNNIGSGGFTKYYKMSVGNYKHLIIL